ncbi:MAG: cupredoxin domain-containing protein [Candidatus Altiarchaeota archaeon]
MKKILCLLLIGVVFFSGCIGTPASDDSSIDDVPQKKHVVSQQATTLNEDATSVNAETTTVKAYLAPSNKPQNHVEFDVVARRYEFEPATIKVKQGDLVRLRVMSADVEHGIAIDDYGISVTVPKGEVKTVEFTADKKGEFAFRCPVYCGSGHARMTGTLIVE